MSDELEQRLRRDLSTLDGVSVGGARRVEAAARTASGRLARRRRRTLAAATVALVGLAGAGAWALGARRDDSAPADTVASIDDIAVSSTRLSPSSSAPASSAAAAEVWRSISADPRGAVVDSAAVWAFADAIVVGGRTLDGDPVLSGAAYSPATDTWRPIADPPDATGASGRINTLAVWTGREMLILGGDLPDGSLLVSYGHAYDPARDEWRVTATPPGVVTSRSPWAWTGTELLVWPSDAGGSSVDAAPLAYDPERDEWRELPAPPVADRQRAASVWTGEEWLVWGGTNDGAELADGAAYDPSTESWRALADSPLSARRVRAVWTGAEMIVAAGSSGGDPVTGNGEFAHGDGAAYDPATDTWRSIAAGPAHPGFEPIWTGDRLLMFAKGGVVTYDAASDQWTNDCCGGSGSTATTAPVWTGTEALFLGSADADVGGVVFTPAALGTTISD